MKGRRLHSVLAAGALVLIAAGAAEGAVFCVSATGTGDGSPADPMGLQAALDAARTNGEDDTIRLQTGPYDAPSGGYVYDSTSNDGMSVTLRAEHSDAPLERIRELGVMLSLGMRIFSGSRQPSFIGMSSWIRLRKTYSTAARVTASGALKLVSDCGDVPAKSIVASVEA